MAEGPLQGKVAIVTGAGSPIGIGHAIALGLVRAGARVAANHMDDPVSRMRAEETAREWAEAGLVMPGDVRSREEMTRFFDAVKAKFGRIDFLINNAAILRDRTIKKLSDEEWNAVIEYHNLLVGLAR